MLKDLVSVRTYMIHQGMVSTIKDTLKAFDDFKNKQQNCMK